MKNANLRRPDRQERHIFERFTRIMAISPQFEHADAPFGTYKGRVVFLKSVVVMSVYIPFIFYAIPFVVAAGVLIRAQIEKMRPTPDVDEAIVMVSDEALVDEMPSNRIRHRYISYTT